MNICLDKKNNYKIIFLISIFVVGVCLRLYKLETPAFWNDEINFILISTNSVRSIVDFCYTYEVHPPLYFFIQKLFFLTGDSNFALRIYPVIFFVATFYVMYKLCQRYCDKFVTYFALVLFSVSPYAILMSRQVRPYSFLCLLFVLSLYFMVLFLESRKYIYLSLLIAANALMINIHYLMIPVPVSQGIILLYCLVKNKVRKIDFLSFCFFSALSSIPTLFFLVPLLLWRKNQYVRTAGSLFDAVSKIITAISKTVLFAVPQGMASVLIMILVIIGMVVVCKRNRMLISVVVTFILYFILCVLFKRIEHLSVFHMYFMFPVLCLFVATAVDVFVLRCAACYKFLLVLLLFVAVSFTDLSYYTKKLYGERAYFSTVYNIGDLSLYEHALPGMINKGEAVVWLNTNIGRAVNWLISRTIQPNYIDINVPSKTDSQIIKYIDFSAYKTPFVRSFVDKSLAAKNYIPEKLDFLDIYTEVVPRIRRIMLSGESGESAIDFTPRAFYSLVNDYNAIKLYPDNSWELVPAAIGKIGTATYRFDFDTQNDAAARDVYVVIGYNNLDKGNRIEAGWSIDKFRSQYKALSSSALNDGKLNYFKISDSDTSRPLYITFSLYCAGNKSMGMYADDVPSIKIKKAFVFYCAKNKEKECRRKVSDLLLKSKSFAQPFFVENLSYLNIAKHVESGQNVFSPQNASEEGSIFFKKNLDNNILYYYPRVSGEDGYVKICRDSCDKNKPEAVYQSNAAGWSPIGAVIPLQLDSEDTGAARNYEIRLYHAQLWERDGALLATYPEAKP
ncbi:glycosyltransferase family 39 protein [Solidesulfovibrio sp. C21]|uniref:glycosyltransferase family 39 protein n=1 Tax=Solidesulfovibrio sp. C21 TaxID=3398613 RepID=UPI0039FCB641